jgi:hypothetical protein
VCLVIAFFIIIVFIICEITGVIIFCSIRFLSKKKYPNRIFFLKKTETKISLNRPVSVRFDFLGQKPVQTSLALFFRFGSVFFWFFRFRFGSVFLVSGL